MSKVITLAKNEIAFDLIIKGDDRREFLGAEVRAYKNSEYFHHCVVEDTMVGMGMLVVLKDIQNKQPGVSGDPVRYKGFVFPNGLAIILGEFSLDGFQSFKELEAYESFLKKLSIPAEDFKPGLELKLSPAVALRLKSVVSVLKEKEKGLAALLGKKKIFGSKDPKEKSAVFQRSNPEELDERGLTVRIDEKFMLTIVSMFEAVGTEMFRIAAGLTALLDLSGFKAKMKVLEEEANKREKELNK